MDHFQSNFGAGFDPWVFNVWPAMFRVFLETFESIKWRTFHGKADDIIVLTAFRYTQSTLNLTYSSHSLLILIQSSMNCRLECSTRTTQAQLTSMNSSSSGSTSRTGSIGKFDTSANTWPFSPTCLPHNQFILIYDHFSKWTVSAHLTVTTQAILIWMNWSKLWPHLDIAWATGSTKWHFENTIEMDMEQFILILLCNFVLLCKQWHRHSALTTLTWME